MIGWVVLLGALLLGACTSNPPPPVAGTRAIYTPKPVTVLCDRGHLIYQSEQGGLAVLSGGCADTGKP
jgi:hypothetical protein